MTPKFNSAEEALGYVLKGHADAIAFCTLICHVLHVWDDLEDRDKPLSRDTIDEMMYAALVVIPRNSFYRDNFHELNALLSVAIMNWHAANQMEASADVEQLRIAFIIRSSYCDIVQAAVRIVGGYAWAKEVTPALRLFWHKEGFEGYINNLSLQFENAKELGHVL